LADGTLAPLNIVFATVLLVRPAAWTVVGEISIVISEINRILITLAFRFEITISLLHSPPQGYLAIPFWHAQSNFELSTQRI
jgi:hypothetical protein